MPNDQKTKTMNFVLPTDEEAMAFLANLLQSSNKPPENQISIRLWLTDVMQDAGRVAMPPPVEPVEGDNQEDEEKAA